MTITSKGQIAIPKDIREFAGFKEGQKVVLIAYNDYIEIKPLEAVTKTKYVHSKEIG